MIVTVLSQNEGVAANWIISNVPVAGICIFFAVITWLARGWVKDVNHRFEKIESRCDHIEDRLTKVEDRLTVVETRLTNVETRLTNIEIRLTKVEEKLDLLIMHLSGGRKLGLGTNE